jgi:hypothetical protein
MLTARMTSIGTLRIGKAVGVPTPASLTLDCPAVLSEPEANVSRRSVFSKRLYNLHLHGSSRGKPAMRAPVQKSLNIEVAG